jgi:hypothetical protein
MVKPSLWLKAYGLGSGCKDLNILILALDGDEWSASRSDHLAPEVIALGPICMGRRLGGPQGRSGQGDGENLCPCWESNHCCPEYTFPVHRYDSA